MNIHYALYAVPGEGDMPLRNASLQQLIVTDREKHASLQQLIVIDRDKHTNVTEWESIEHLE